jgi:phosphoribosylglycinamide formyltransferase-1
MLKFGVMASGSGSNFKAILDRIQSGEFQAQCLFLISNNGNCGAVGYAKDFGVPVFHISGKTHPDGAAYEAALLDVVDRFGVDLVVLAGYMKVLPSSFIQRLPARILNIHPSLLPKYGGKGFYGMHVHEAVIAAGEQESGATVHLVGEEIDSGRILTQGRVPVLPGDTPEVLASRIHEVEYQIYWKAIRDYGKEVGSKG